MLGQLVDDDIRASRNEFVEPAIDLRQPVVVQRARPPVAALAIRWRPAIRGWLTPASRLAYYGQSQLIHAFVEQLRDRFRSERAAIVKMFVQPICDRLPKFRVVQALLPDPLRIAPGILVARRIRAGPVFVDFQKRMLGIPDVVAEPLVPVSIADAVPIVGRTIRTERRDWGVQIASIKNHEHVVDQVVDIEEHLIVRVACAIGIVAKNPLVGGIRLEAGLADFPKPLPRIERAVGGKQPVLRVALAFALAAADLDHVKVILLALEIRGTKRGFGALDHVEQPPVVAVDVQVTVMPACSRLAKRELHVAVELVAHERAARIIAQAPRVIAKCPQVDVVKLLRGVLAKHRILQLGRAVFAAEKETKRVLGVGGHPAEPSANSHATIFLKTGLPVRADHFQRTRAFPLTTIVFCVGKNAGLLVEQVVHLHHKRVTRKRTQPVKNLILVTLVIDHTLIHPVVHVIESPLVRETVGRQPVRRLPHNVLREKVCTRHHLGRLEARLETGHPQHGGLFHLQQTTFQNRPRINRRD